ncbi:MAG: type II toxin-antitoxin system RelB/DinJ family antitoxin [bacterium]
MAKTTIIRARIEPMLKNKAEQILNNLGLSATQAIALFYRQVELNKGLPFEAIIPNKTTRNTFEDTDADRNLIMCKDTDDMFQKLGI